MDGSGKNDRWASERSHALFYQGRKSSNEREPRRQDGNGPRISHDPSENAPRIGNGGEGSNLDYEGVIVGVRSREAQVQWETRISSAGVGDDHLRHLTRDDIDKSSREMNKKVAATFEKGGEPILPGNPSLSWNEVLEQFREILVEGKVSKETQTMIEDLLSRRQKNLQDCLRSFPEVDLAEREDLAEAEDRVPPHDVDIFNSDLTDDELRRIATGAPEFLEDLKIVWGEHYILERLTAISRSGNPIRGPSRSGEMSRLESELLASLSEELDLEAVE